MAYILPDGITHEDCIRGWGKPDTQGYLRVSLDNKVYFAHRLAYVAANGAVPQGMHVHHLCDNKTCVNPIHLVAITLKQHFSIHTKPKSDDYFANQEFCKYGHKFDGTTYERHGRKTRICVECRRKRSREWAKKKSQDPIFRENKNRIRRECMQRRKANSLPTNYNKAAS
jgi:hypothetical protein